MFGAISGNHDHQTISWDVGCSSYNHQHNLNPHIHRFLLAQFHMDALARKHNLRQVRKVLQALPDEINRTYDDAIKRIFDHPKDSSQLAMRTLSWIVCANCPLTIKELQHAFAVDLEDKVYDEEAMPQEDLVVSLCAGLVTVEKESGLMRLVHYTTQQYFELKREELFHDAENDIANTCLIYLVHVIDDLVESQTMNLYDRAYFLQYACMNWEYHTSRATEEAVFGSALSFFKHYDRINNCMELAHPPHGMLILLELSREELVALGADGFTSLAMVSKLSLYNTAKALIAWGVNVDAVTKFDSHMRGFFREEHLGTALHVAAFYGEKKPVELLLASGAALDTPHMQISALHCAVQKRNQDMVRLLLRRGANLHSTDEKGLTPFHLAIWRGYDDIAKLLLDNGANIEAETSDDYRSKPLHLIEQVSTACWLIDHGGQLEARDAEGYTPLLRLLLDRSDWQNAPPLSLIGTLIQRGANIQANNDKGLGVLHLTLQPSFLIGWLRIIGEEPIWTEHILRLLLAYGATTEAKQNDRGLTPLLHICDVYVKNDEYSRCCRKEWFHEVDLLERLASILLEAGASVSAVDEEGLTPLHYLAKGPHNYNQIQIKLVNMLREHGANPKTRDSRGRTASDIFLSLHAESNLQDLREFVPLGAVPSEIIMDWIPFVWDTDDVLKKPKEVSETDAQGIHPYDDDDIFGPLFNI